MGLQQGTFSNAVVSVDNDGNVTRIQNGPRLQRVRTRGTQTDVTALRAFGGIYQNTSGSLMLIQGWATTAGSAVGSLEALNGDTNPPTDTVWADEKTATVSGAKVGFAFSVPAGKYYQLNNTGAVNALGKWFETIVS